jgi:cytochrome c peroxidase
MPAGCSGCHSGPSFTDDLMHVVLTPESLTSDDVFTTANTPGLHGISLKPPYFHDGRSPSLPDLLTRADAAKHGGAQALSAAQQADLLAYLNSL